MNAARFESKVSDSWQMLEPIAMKLTRNRDAANDLIQDTMVKAISNRDKFKRGTNLKAWLYTIMRNTFISNYHRAKRKQTIFDSTENLYFLNSNEHSIENTAVSKLIQEEIYEEIERLSDLYKVPFLMYFKGYKYQEIADVMDIPLGTVKNRIHIARKELKRKLMNRHLAN